MSPIRSISISLCIIGKHELKKLTLALVCFRALWQLFFVLAEREKSHSAIQLEKDYLSDPLVDA